MIRKKTRILILCTANSARSQMAEALLRHDSGDQFEVFSAGTQPSYVRPEAIAVMREIGIDIADQRSKSVEEFCDQAFDVVLTVCDSARENCPVFPGAGTRLHRSVPDPVAAGGSLAVKLEMFRLVRDELRAYLRTLRSERFRPERTTP
jgi:arsenate reductase